MSHNPTYRGQQKLTYNWFLSPLTVVEAQTSHTFAERLALSQQAFRWLLGFGLNESVAWVRWCVFSYIFYRIFRDKPAINIQVFRWRKTAAQHFFHPGSPNHQQKYLKSKRNHHFFKWWLTSRDMFSVFFSWGEFGCEIEV